MFGDSLSVAALGQAILGEDCQSESNIPMDAESGVIWLIRSKGVVGGSSSTRFSAHPQRRQPAADDYNRSITPDRPPSAHPVIFRSHPHTYSIPIPNANNTLIPIKTTAINLLVNV